MHRGHDVVALIGVEHHQQDAGDDDSGDDPGGQKDQPRDGRGEGCNGGPSTSCTWFVPRVGVIPCVRVAPNPAAPPANRPVRSLVDGKVFACPFHTHPSSRSVTVETWRPADNLLVTGGG